MLFYSLDSWGGGGGRLSTTILVSYLFICTTDCLILVIQCDIILCKLLLSMQCAGENTYQQNMVDNK